ncbi:hypothetical protein [Rufibacter ruber]|nr:hypothetical protein [Rufibacter ruber]
MAEELKAVLGLFSEKQPKNRNTGGSCCAAPSGMSSAFGQN